MEAGARARVEQQPGRHPVVENPCGVLDAAARIEQQGLGRLAGCEIGEALRRQGVEPAEPVVTGDREHIAVRQVDEGVPRGERPLLPHRVAVVGRGVADRAASLYSTRASLPEEWVRRSWPSAAMSHAHSR